MRHAIDPSHLKRNFRTERENLLAMTPRYRYVRVKTTDLHLRVGLQHLADDVRVAHQALGQRVVQHLTGIYIIIKFKCFLFLGSCSVADPFHLIPTDQDPVS